MIDNFARRILSWRVSQTFDPTNTVEILAEAGRTRSAGESPTTLLVDGGVENKTTAINNLVESGTLQRVLAQTEISCSNSMIESWWRQLKHQWLFLNQLDSVSAVQKLAEFYVGEHNTRLPHSAFEGQTPDEMYFGTGDNVAAELQTRRKEARAERMAANRVRACRVYREIEKE